MPECAITITSPPGTADSAKQLERFTNSLMMDGRLLHPQPSVTEDGRLRFSATLTAENMDEASLAACLPYWAAIGDAGLTLADHSEVQIARTDEQGTFSAQMQITRTN
ncbi:MAG TPA: hypothetical protein VJ716_02425 [Gaiellaceae bacterium]|nr:hypothetical protein [Gaiellaceae bacterium]